MRKLPENVGGGEIKALTRKIFGGVTHGGIRGVIKMSSLNNIKLTRIKTKQGYTVLNIFSLNTHFGTLSLM